jgi:hypothetical protein
MEPKNGRNLNRDRLPNQSDRPPATPFTEIRSVPAMAASVSCASQTAT